MLFDEFRYGDFPIPQGWRENLSAGLAATQERLIVPHSFEDAFLVLRFSFLFVQEEYVSQDGFKMRILWQAINNGPYAPLRPLWNKLPPRGPQLAVRLHVLLLETSH